MVKIFNSVEQVPAGFSGFFTTTDSHQSISHVKNYNPAVRFFATDGFFLQKPTGQIIK